MSHTYSFGPWSIRRTVVALPALALVALATLIAALAPAARTTAGSAAVSAAPVNVTPALAALAKRDPAARVRVIVQLRPGLSASAGERLIRSRAGAPGRHVRIINALDARISAAGAVALATDRGIKAVSLDAPIASRGSISTANLKTSFDWSVRATNPWNNAGATAKTGKGVGVAVVDTGIDGSLPDFRTSQTNATSRVVASVVVNPRATTPTDRFGHGTHVAGLIAGNAWHRPSADPLRGDYIGAAPDAKLISIKASDDHGLATTLDVIYGIQFAVDHKADYNIRVLNLSLASTVAESYRTDPLDAAVESAWLKGIFVVAAAGNDGGAPGAVGYAPGNDPYVLTVGAVDDKGTLSNADDALASWSSHGITQDGFAKPDLLAPGAHIVSTVPATADFRTLCPACVVDGSYFQVGGTSMAAAIVSGVAAIHFERNPGWTPNEMKGALTSTARDVPGVGVEVDAYGPWGGSGVNTVSNENLTPNDLVDGATGDIDYTAASWRAASWRGLTSSDPLSATWSAASWRCDCSVTSTGAIDPQAASWRAASWRTSFEK